MFLDLWGSGATIEGFLGAFGESEVFRGPFAGPTGGTSRENGLASACGWSVRRREP